MELQIESTQDMPVAEDVQKKGKSEKGVNYPVIRVQLPKSVALSVQETLLTLKERKADTKVDELLSEFIETLSADYLEEQLEKHTPEAYYLEAAAAIPEIRAKFIEQAKKALSRKSTPRREGPAPKKKVRKPKEESSMAIDSGLAPDSNPMS